MKIKLPFFNITIQRRRHPVPPTDIQKLLDVNSKALRVRETNAVAILANGPSLNQIAIEEIVEEEVIVMNHFYRHPSADNLNIVAYCMGENGSSVRQRPLSSNLSLTIRSIMDTSAKSYWFSTDLSDVIDTSDTTFFYYLSGADTSTIKSIDLTKPSPVYFTTAQMAIFVAIYLGYENISLYGYDHNMLSLKGKQLDHFYGDYPEGYPKDLYQNKKASKADYYSRIVFCEKMWRTYQAIENFANENGVHIVNKSPESYLDVFSFS